PALRLADVGVAMGRGGTEVARQAADVVLADDDFATLVEGVIEGRGFWQSLRKALALLLGGNLGEMGLIVGTSVLGLPAPLNPVPILVVNLITDALPALSVVLRRPEQRDLRALARDGPVALGASLRRDVLRRGTATALPSLAAHLVARGAAGQQQAGAVAFGSIVTTQLAQTLDAGWTGGRPNGAVLGAVAGSAGMTLAALTLRPLRGGLGLALPSPASWALMGGAARAAGLPSPGQGWGRPPPRAPSPPARAGPPPRAPPRRSWGTAEGQVARCCHPDRLRCAEAPGCDARRRGGPLRGPSTHKTRACGGLRAHSVPSLPRLCRTSRRRW